MINFYFIEVGHISDEGGESSHSVLRTHAETILPSLQRFLSKIISQVFLYAPLRYASKLVCWRLYLDPGLLMCCSFFACAPS